MLEIDMTNMLSFCFLKMLKWNVVHIGAWVVVMSSLSKGVSSKKVHGEMGSLIPRRDVHGGADDKQVVN